MGKDKLKRFREMEAFDIVVQPLFEEVFHNDHRLKGRWREDFFSNGGPIVLELGCGRGEYTVAMARMFPDRNFIGVDIKGARMWRGAKTAVEEGLGNAAFLRTRIEFIESLFGPGEVDEIWITFPDAQLDKKRIKKRLTAPAFLKMYSRFLKPGGVVRLKTDSLHLHLYTKAVAEANGLPIAGCSADIYGTEGYAGELLSVKTAYESRFLAEGLPITYLEFGLDGRDDFSNIEFAPDSEL